MKARAIVSPPASPAPKAAAKPIGRPKLAPLVVAAAPVAKLALAKAKSSAPWPVRIAKAAPSPKTSRKAQLAQAAAARAAARRSELAQLAAKAEVAKSQKAELAMAEAKGRAEARAEVKAEAVAFARDDARKRARLAALTHVVQKLLQHRAKPATIEVAKVDNNHAHKVRQAAQVERASLKTRRSSRLIDPPSHARALPVAPQPRAGLMKVSTPRCASRDPGEAIVCADPSLGAAERQLARAYQGARAAGVPDTQLQRQQQQWLAARSSAAREAPWAVRDVYLARIAELNGQAREAHADGY
jgi:hypothetical protein